jgi:hypothetical protein
VTATSQPLDLLARSATLMSTSLDGAMHVMPTRATPCAQWDLGTLISHVAQSVDLLIRSVGGSPEQSYDPDCRARARAGIRRLLLELRHAPRDHRDIELAALTGSFELTVHAWDIAESTRCQMSPPADLVSSLLELAPVVLGDLDRDGLFDLHHPPTPSQRTDLDRLLALFGRRRKEAP